MTTADVDGIDIAGLLIDAGQKISPVLMEVGPEGSKARHTARIRSRFTTSSSALAEPASAGRR